MTNLRQEFRGLTLDESLVAREKISANLRQNLDRMTQDWGLKVCKVEIKLIDPPNDIKLAMHKQKTFDVRFNPLFLVYVALLGCSTYALIGGLITTDWEGFTAGFTERTPTKAVSIYLGMLASLFYLLWLSEAVPASLSGNPPQSLIDAGTPTNFVQVLDMAWLLPAIAITAISLWRKRSLGYTLAGALLTHFTLLTLAILSMVAFMVRAGQPVVIPQVVIYGVLFAVSIGMAIAYLKNLKSSPSPMQ